MWPFALAAGIALVLIGIVVSPKIVVPLGVGVLVIALIGWTRESREAHAEPVELEPERRAPGAATPADGGEPAATSDDESEARFPRNVFLEGATLGLGGVIGGLVTIPVLGFTVLPAFTKQHKIQADLGPVADFPEGEWRIATFLTNPDVGEISRQTAFIRQNAQLEGKPSFTIISNHCAHLGCPVQPGALIQKDQKKEIRTATGKVTIIPMQKPSSFNCPCHGGAYNTEGNRIAGPPVRALDRFSFSIANGRLILEKPYSVAKVEGEAEAAKIWKYAFRNPGQHVDGPERFLYPIQPPR